METPPPRWLIVLPLLLVVCVPIAYFGAPFRHALPYVSYHVLLGWLIDPFRVLPQVNVGWSGVATAVVCAVLLGLGLHSFLKWHYASMVSPSDAEPAHNPRWQPRWTLSILTLVLLMLVIGIAAVGITHQITW